MSLLENGPVIFGVGIFMAASVGSALFWRRVFSRAGREDLVRKRRRLWQAHVWFGGAIAILLAALAALTSGGGGHGGLVIVWALGLWCAAGLALTVCFTLMSYPVEFLLSKGARRADPPGS